MEIRYRDLDAIAQVNASTSQMPGSPVIAAASTRVRSRSATSKLARSKLRFAAYRPALLDPNLISRCAPSPQSLAQEPHGMTVTPWLPKRCNRRQIAASRIQANPSLLSPGALDRRFRAPGALIVYPLRGRCRRPNSPRKELPHGSCFPGGSLPLSRRRHPDFDCRWPRCSQHLLCR